MTNSVLSPNTLVTVDVNLGIAGVQSQSLSNMLVVGITDVINVQERIRNYTTLAGVITDFGTSAPEYFAAAAYFAQSPQPITLSIGRWAKTATQGILIGAPVTPTNQLVATWTSISNGAFQIAINGGSVTPIGPINFTTVTNLNGVASLIEAALATASISATVLWNSSYQQFTIESSVTGPSSAVSFLTSPVSGTDISNMLGLSVLDSGAYTVAGIAAESAVSAAALFDLNYGTSYYGYTQLGVADSDILAIALLIEGSSNKHIYFNTTQEGGVLSATSTTDIAYLLAQEQYKRSCLQYSSTNPYAVLSFAARLLTVNYEANQSVITMMYKQEPTVLAETLNVNQLNALIAKNCNVFVTYSNNATIIQNGVVASGDYIDIISGSDWLAISIQISVFNLLYTTPTKIPQTDPGNGQIKGQIVLNLNQAVNNGLLAPGVWESAGFGILNYGDYLTTGYYVYQPSVDTQAPTDRAARKSVVFQVAAKLAGAVQTASILLNFNR